MTLYENEREDFVNDDLTLIQKTDGLVFGTDALLLAGYVKGRYSHAAELGGGSGIISMLLITRKKCDSCDVYEIQPEYAELIERNAERNSLSGLRSIRADIREIPGEKRESCDIVLTNPPYMKADGGERCTLDAKNIARHEVFGTIDDFCRAAKRLLKYGGTFAAVYRPDRLIDLIAAMRAHGLEPKRMTFVHADERSRSSMVLVEAKRGGKGGLFLTKPLLLYKDSSHKEFSEEMKYIDENGCFPPDFISQGGA
ncbi:MAG: methyltransferase [Clostridia bacterium]|nr:methyltransferase [Clostridia bacterium]